MNGRRARERRAAQPHPKRAIRVVSAQEQSGARGDCYEASFVLANEFAVTGIRAFVCHGMVTGQGPVEGVRFGHAWVEVPEAGLVYDYSNGHRTVLPLERYYALGEITARRRYSVAQIRRLVLIAGHYGPDWYAMPADEVQS